MYFFRYLIPIINTCIISIQVDYRKFRKITSKEKVLENIERKIEARSFPFSS